jgi:hypothetical protein
MESDICCIPTDDVPEDKLGGGSETMLDHQSNSSQCVLHLKKQQNA